MKDDPVIAEIRRVRHRIPAKCHHDPKRLMEHQRKFEQKLRKSGKFRFLDDTETIVAANDAK